MRSPFTGVQPQPYSPCKSTRMMNNRMKKGSSRKVYFLGPIVIKLPIHNHRHEREDNIVEWNLWKQTKSDKLCPVLGCFFKGRILIMRRAKEIIEDLNLDPNWELEDWPAGDLCIENIGWFRNKVVMVDYAEEKDLYD